VVEDTGKALRAETGKPLNTPEMLAVEENESGRPVAVRMKYRQAVTIIEDCWRIDDEWWRTNPISRLYYRVRLTSGQRLVLFKDLVAGNWYKQDY
jgi:hypothetical protein